MQEPWIAFEGLGIVFENVQRGFTIGEVTIYWYGVLIAIGFLLAVILGLRSCEKFGISQDDLLTYIITAMPAAVVGARLYFVAFSRAESVLLLVGLYPAIEGYTKRNDHFNIPNIALGWSRDENYVGFKEIYLI